MTPIAHFQSVWDRCEQLCVIHTYLESQLTNALTPDELLRAEWVARLSALDLYIHELVAQRMREIFEGVRPTTPGFLKFQIPNDVLMRTLESQSLTGKSSAFELEVRNKLSILTYQDPEKIADAIRLISEVELWNEIALKLGATTATKSDESKRLKLELSLIVQRRNKIAHEGDLQPSNPRTPWSVEKADVRYVTEVINKIVKAIDQIV
jgi:hypothetical protein